MKISDLQNHFKDESFSLFDNITIHTISGLALHPGLKEKIDALYLENKKEYFRSYKNSKFYKTPYFQIYPATDEVQMMKITSMYVYKKDDGVEFLTSLIKDGYKRIYDYVSMQKVLSMDSFIEFYLDRHHSIVPEPLQTLVSAIALFIGFPDKEIVPLQNDPVLHTVLYNMHYNEISMHNDPSFLAKKKKNEFQSLKKFQESMGIKLGKNDLLDTVWTKHEEVLGKLLSKNEKDELIKKGNFKPLYNKGLYRFWKPLTSIVRLHGINDMNFSLVPISRDDVNDIFTVFSLSKEMERLKEEEFDFFLTSSFANLMMIKQYKILRDEYIHLFEQDSGFSEIELEEIQLEKEKTFSEREKTMEVEIAHLREKTYFQELNILELQKEIKTHDFNIDEFEKLKKEVVSLRDYVFSKESNETFDSFDEDENVDLIAMIKEKKIAIIGGHQKWHQKIKSVLENVRTVHPDEINVDLSFLQNMDVVLIETSYNNHTLYHKALSYLNKSETKLIYLNQQANINHLISLIHQKI